MGRFWHRRRLAAAVLERRSLWCWACWPSFALWRRGSATALLPRLQARSAAPGSGAWADGACWRPARLVLGRCAGAFIVLQHERAQPCTETDSGCREERLRADIEKALAGRLRSWTSGRPSPPSPWTFNCIPREPRVLTATGSYRDREPQRCRPIRGDARQLARTHKLELNAFEHRRRQSWSGSSPTCNYRIYAPRHNPWQPGERRDAALPPPRCARARIPQQQCR